MEKDARELLEDIKSVLDAVRTQLSSLEQRLEALAQDMEHVKGQEIVEDVPQVLSETGAETDPENSVEGIPATDIGNMTMMDMMAEKEAWRKDLPGMPVKDIRSAISLNDRALFIRSLFKEDPMSFSDAVTAINGMETLEEAVAYIRSSFPEWDMESDQVYRFMMAVRRKLRQ